MEDEPVGDDLEAHLDREDGREEVVEVVQDLEKGKKGKSKLFSKSADSNARGCCY